jgi:hypothetical protein
MRAKPVGKLHVFLAGISRQETRVMVEWFKAGENECGSRIDAEE